MSRTLRGVNSPLTARLRKREDAARAEEIKKAQGQKAKSTKTSKTVKAKASSSTDTKTTKSKKSDAKAPAVEEKE